MHSGGIGCKEGGDGSVGGYLEAEAQGVAKPDHIDVGVPHSGPDEPHPGVSSSHFIFTATLQLFVTLAVKRSPQCFV